MKQLTQAEKRQLKNRVGERYLTNNGWLTIKEYHGCNSCTVQYDDGETRENVFYTSIKSGNVGKLKNRVGEKYITMENYEIEIIGYLNCSNCTIMFSDGSIKTKVVYADCKSGKIKKPLGCSRVGEKYITNEGYSLEIIDYLGELKGRCTVLLSDNIVLYNIRYHSIINGSVKNPYHPSLCGIGYIGEGVYKSKMNNASTKYYCKWNGMFSRCYNTLELKKHPSYIECSVAKEWHNFQNFAKWHEENWKLYMDEKWHLDKDILFKGNKIYSPETCCFVPQEINILFVKPLNKKSGLPMGVTKQKGRFISNLNRRYLGSFDTIEEAFQVYKTAKEDYIKEVADKWRGQITEEVYKALINYKIEITD